MLESSSLQELVADKVAKLLVDASRAFFGLSAASLSLGLFGRALRYIGHSLTCLLAARPQWSDLVCMEELLTSVWKLCGNVHMMLAKVCACVLTLLITSFTMYYGLPKKQEMISEDTICTKISL